MDKYNRTLLILIDEANSIPTEENLMKVENYISFYSDVYKDEYGVRPDVSQFRDMYNGALKKLWKNMWDRL